MASKKILVENFELTVSDNIASIVFDVQVKTMSDEISIALAPHVRNGSFNGCIVINMYRDDKEAVISIFIHNTKCAKNMTMEKKYGTRRMLLGACLFVRDLASRRMPTVNKFVLTDEASYPCPPLSMAIKTFATSVLLYGKTYYEKHLNMKPVTHRVRKAIKQANKTMKSEIYDTFDVFWKRIREKQAFSDRNILQNTQSPSQLAWLDNNKSDIRIIFIDAINSKHTWRKLFETLYDKYGCTFFASCALRLVDYFELNKLLGAAYKVRFKNLPQDIDDTKLTIKTQVMKGGSAKRLDRLQRMYMKHAMEKAGFYN